MGKDLKGKELGIGIRQLKDGRYCGRFTDRFGKRQEFKDKSLVVVRDWYNTATYEDKMKLNVIDKSITLNDWYKKWLEIYKYSVIRPNTKRHYEQVYNKHIKPVLGKLKLDSITQLQIRGLIKELDKSGYRFETKNKVKVLLVDMYNKAMIDEFARKNPARGIKIVRDEEKDIRVLSKQEQIDFFECAKGTFYYNLFLVALTSGLRPGEVFALTRDDIDFENKWISVNKTLLYQTLEGDDKKTFHLGPPKTPNSIRRVPMNTICEEAIQKQLMQKVVVSMKAPASKTKKLPQEFLDFIFTTSHNTPINSQILCDAIKKIVNEINLTRSPLEEFELFSGHTFRHTFATRCFEAGIQPKTVQKYLGHASLKMTMDLYTHVLEEQEVDEMKKLEESLILNSSTEHNEDKSKLSGQIDDRQEVAKFQSNVKFAFS